MTPESNPKSERGAALVVALLILLVVTLFGLAAIGTSTMELRMAANTEARQQAVQQAQAAVDYLTVTPSLLPVTGGVGYKLCTANLSGCDQTNIDLPLPLNDDTGGPNTLTVTRQNPGTGLPPRIMATSSAAFASAYYNATSTYDARANRGAKVSVVVGLMRVVPK
ncbi:MAG: PilX N-terminal [Proteobacteria bacterium]|nr:PilX N-terminal [Pseudomonadota bacterium]